MRVIGWQKLGGCGRAAVSGPTEFGCDSGSRFSQKLSRVSSSRMALTATVHTFAIELADVDRGVYEKLDLRVARQPSVTAAYMLTRLLAYLLEFTEGISFTEGVAAGHEPAVLVRIRPG